MVATWFLSSYMSPSLLSSRSDVFGHPRGLAYLCVAEACERFSYYGMQSLLVLYMTHQLLLPGHVEQVVGFRLFRSAIEQVTGPLSPSALASQIFGVYAGFVYLTPLIGGFVADRYLGRTATVMLGAMVMAAGHFLMAFERSFLFAILLLLVGVGAFKGNIASQVGELYAEDDPRRATAFQVFMLFVSLAVIVSPLVCGTLGERVGWHWGFGAAGVGMLFGLACYWQGRPWLPAPRRQEIGDTAAEKLSTADWKRVLLLVGLLPVLAAVMLGNQQLFNAFIVWGEAHLDLHLAGYDMPVTWLLSFDALISSGCLVLSIVAWRAYAKRWREPDDLTKIAIGGAIMTIAPFLLALASLQQTATGAKGSILWGLAFQLINDLGFALVFPVSLSLYSRLAPPQVRGLMIGVYYLSLFMCNLAVGRLGGLLERMSGSAFWLMHAAIIGSGALVLGILAFASQPRPDKTNPMAS